MCGVRQMTEPTSTCPDCGAIIDDNAGSCLYCRDKCSNCGAIISEKTGTCPNCGLKPGERVLMYSGFWRRFAAAFIDGLILSIGGLVFAVLIGYYTVEVQLLTILIGFVYTAGLESSKSQATIGKLALGIKVADLNGNRISCGRATMRYIVEYIGIMLLFIVYLTIPFSKNKQGIHDMIAGTIVIKDEVFMKL